MGEKSAPLSPEALNAKLLAQISVIRKLTAELSGRQESKDPRVRDATAEKRLKADIKASEKKFSMLWKMFQKTENGAFAFPPLGSDRLAIDVFAADPEPQASRPPPAARGASPEKPFRKADLKPKPPVKNARGPKTTGQKQAVAASLSQLWNGPAYQAREAIVKSLDRRATSSIESDLAGHLRRDPVLRDALCEALSTHRAFNRALLSVHRDKNRPQAEKVRRSLTLIRTNTAPTWRATWRN